MSQLNQYRLIQGSVATSPVAHLNARAVWLGVNSAVASGPYMEVSPSGIVCITSPCPSFIAGIINRNVSENFDKLNFAKAKLTPDQELRAWKELNTKGLVITGLKYDFAVSGVPTISTGVHATKVFFKYPK